MNRKGLSQRPLGRVDRDHPVANAQFDNRAGDGRIASRIGIGEPADTFAPGTDFFAKLAARFALGPVACVFIDEAQFLTREQVWQLARAVDDRRQ